MNLVDELFTATRNFSAYAGLPVDIAIVGTNLEELSHRLLKHTLTSSTAALTVVETSNNAKELEMLISFNKIFPNRVIYIPGDPRSVFIDPSIQGMTTDVAIVTPSVREESAPIAIFNLYLSLARGGMLIVPRNFNCIPTINRCLEGRTMFFESQNWMIYQRYQ